MKRENLHGILQCIISTATMTSQKLGTGHESSWYSMQHLQYYVYGIITINMGGVNEGYGGYGYQGNGYGQGFAPNNNPSFDAGYQAGYNQGMASSMNTGYNAGFGGGTVKQNCRLCSGSGKRFTSDC